MSPERLARLRVIGVTALITFFATIFGAAVVATVVGRRPPPTPQLAPPKTVTVTLYPVPGFCPDGCPPTETPAGEVDRVMRLVTPDKYDERGVNDWLTPLIAVVSITHEGEPATCVYVRWAGESPATVSVDGRNYFFARPQEGIHDGGKQLVRLVRRLAEAKTR